MRNHDLALELGLEQVVPTGGGLDAGVLGQPVLVGAKAERADVDARPLVVGVLGTGSGRADWPCWASRRARAGPLPWRRRSRRAGRPTRCRTAGCPSRCAGGPAASPLDMRTKLTVMSGLAFSNSAFMPSHHCTCGRAQHVEFGAGSAGIGGSPLLQWQPQPVAARAVSAAGAAAPDGGGGGGAHAATDQSAAASSESRVAARNVRCIDCLLSFQGN